MYKNYTLEPEDRRFNLYKAVTRTKEATGEKYDSQDSLGYGMSLDHCIETIITDSLADKQETLTLRQYIDEYKKLKTEVLKD